MVDSQQITVRWQGRSQTFEPADAPITIGRDASAHVVVTSEGVSRRHARLDWSSGHWVFVDTQSSQGSRVDGRRVDQLVLERPVDITLAHGSTAEVIRLEPPDSGSRTVTPGGDRTALPGGDRTVVVSGNGRPGGRLTEREVGATQLVGETLAVECGGTATILVPGREYLIGRDPSADVVSSNPNVSRRHAVLVHRGGSWIFTDAGSNGGSFLDGSRVKESRIGGSMVFLLGDPEAGERLVVKASGERQLTVGQRLGRLGRGGRVGLVGAGCAVVALLVAVVAIRGGGSSKPDFDKLTRAVVRIEAQDSATGGTGGSGTIIDNERGLILTNAHVAGWGVAEGLALNYGYDERFLQDIEEIVISVSPGQNLPAEPAYRAKLLVADGYLDLAVLQITQTLSGKFVEAKDLERLTEIDVGSVDGIETGDDVYVLGFPGVSNNESALITDGPVSAFVPDARSGNNRGWIQMDVQIRGGNSGGLLADDKGRLIGVPSLARGGDLLRAGESSVATSRSIDLGKDLIKSAISGEPYESPYVTLLTGSETITGIAYGNLIEKESGFVPECGNPLGETGLAGDQALAVQLTYEGLTAGRHQDMLVTLVRQPISAQGAAIYAKNDIKLPTGSDEARLVGSVQTTWPTIVNAEEGCLTATMVLDQELYPLFNYILQVQVGGNLKILATDTWTPS